MTTVKKEQDKKNIPPVISEWYAKCGSKGGSSTSEKKQKSSRKNGLTPCRPGKFRGRPPKSGRDRSEALN